MKLAEDFHLRLLFLWHPVACLIAAGLWAKLLEDL